jgi:hypothetical protein
MTILTRLFHPTVLLGTLLLCSSASADCDISQYDRTAPKAIINNVTNGVAFEWATDVDTSDGRNWIWHYIKNKDNRGLGYRWPKAQLRHIIGTPLEAGNTDCNRYFVLGPVAPDDNAPITYGTSDTTQRAAVFAETNKSAEINKSSDLSAGSIVETSYRGRTGNLENVRVVISTTANGKNWVLTVEQTPNVFVALATPKDISTDLFPMLAEQLRATLPVKFSSKELIGLYSDEELSSRTVQSFAVMTSHAPIVAAKVQASAFIQTSSDLVLLKEGGEAFFAASVRLIAPSTAR